MKKKIKVLHIISGLNIGGAETVLYRLLSNLDKNIFESQVISLSDFGPIGNKIRTLGIYVIALGMRRGVPNPLYILRLIILLRKIRPDVIQTWMHHADLIAGIAGKLSGPVPIIWNIRVSSLDKSKEKCTTRWTVKLCALLSHFVPNLIISVAESAKRDAINQGYDGRRIITIPNGVDANIFKPDSQSKRKVRKQLNVPVTSTLIGLIARFDPQKDHQNFIRAASLVWRNFPEAYFLMCGDDVKWENRELNDMILRAGLKSNCFLLGRCDDIPLITASLDIAVLSSSYGEGLPNVIIEAMACGIPCIATDVGDSALIVGNIGKIVPKKNPKLLALGIIELLSIRNYQRIRLGKMARERVLKYFSIERMVASYEKIYKNIYKFKKDYSSFSF